MIIRTIGINAGGGEFKAGNASLLLEYLGVKQEAAGVQKITQDVELITSVPFSMNREFEPSVRGTENNGQEGFAWVLSTFDLDRYGERIDPAGWDFNRYMQNPVVEWAHRYDIPAIGKMENLAVDDNGLHGSVFFNSKEFDPFGWSIGERVKAGVIRAGSVGFRVIEIEIPSKEDSKGGTFLIFRKQELLEFSICNVPANPFALANGMNSEQLTKNKESSDLTALYWGGLFNFHHP